MLIFYRDVDARRTRPVADALGERRAKELTDSWVCCSLIRDYEADRRYVAQFGVERAPALIIISADGTYRATTQLVTTEDVFAFLEGDDMAVMTSTSDPRVPRKPTYHWLKNLDEAEMASGESRRPVLIAFYRPLTRDWSGLKKILNRREVHGRFADLVHCRLSLLHRANKAQMKRFGLTESPALVILHPDGRYQSLPLPISSEAVVRFADQSLSDGAISTNEVIDAATAP